MNTIERYDTAFKFTSVLSYAHLAYTYYRLWVLPTPEDAEQILTYSLLMLFEFILIHSGVFMALFSKSRAALLFFIVFYSGFAFALNRLAPNNTILITYMFVVFNRMKTAFYARTPAMKRNIMKYSAVVATLYFFLLIAFVFGEGLIPALGVTEGFLSAIGYHSLTSTGGMFIEEPRVPLALGVVYFSVLGLGELWSILAKQKKSG